jgi:hypothetical protein
VALGVADGDPLPDREFVEVGEGAEAAAAAGVAQAAERGRGFVVDGLVVDVDHAGA